MILSNAPRPDTGQQSEHGPDTNGLEAGARGEPIKCILIEQTIAESEAFGRIAMAPHQPAFAPAKAFDSRRTILPGTRGDETGDDQEKPAQTVNSQQRPPEVVHAQFVEVVPGTKIREAGARPEKERIE